MIAMLLKSLGASDWARLLSFVSPVFFKVVPLKELSRAVQSGVMLSRQIDQLEELKSCPDDINKKIFTWQKNTTDGKILNTGDIALRIYFAMIFGQNNILLDITSKSIQSTNPAILDLNTASEIIWRPGAVAYPFQNSFLTSLRQIYSGFYFQNDTSFARGLQELNLTPCSNAFKELFGAGDQTAVAFRMSDFTIHFHRIFTLCKENKIALHGDFVALGVFLSFLYEHLEALSQNSEIKSWNARQAFMEGSGLSENF
jgi:hypothetical protein